MLFFKIIRFIKINNYKYKNNECKNIFLHKSRFCFNYKFYYFKNHKFPSYEKVSISIFCKVLHKYEINDF